jgi:hypothetical protein
MVVNHFSITPTNDQPLPIKMIVERKMTSLEACWSVAVGKNAKPKGARRTWFS